MNGCLGVDLGSPQVRREDACGLPEPRGPIRCRRRGAMRRSLCVPSETIEFFEQVGNERGQLRGGAPKKKETMGQKIDDASITAEVKMVLLSHRSTSAVHTKVTTKKGVVSLSGKARNAAEIDLVTNYVSDIKGVKRVKNHMTVGDSK
jgi:osmotically-inducible protein OsmY